MFSRLARSVSRSSNILSKRSPLFSSSSNRSASTLVVGESNDDGTLNVCTLNAVTAAKTLGGPISLLVYGSNVTESAESGSKIDGVETVLHADDAAFDHGVAENVAQLLVDIQKDKSFTHIIACMLIFVIFILKSYGSHILAQDLG